MRSMRFACPPNDGKCKDRQSNPLFVLALGEAVLVIRPKNLYKTKGTQCALHVTLWTALSMKPPKDRHKPLAILQTDWLTHNLLAIIGFTKRYASQYRPQDCR